MKKIFVLTCLISSSTLWAQAPNDTQPIDVKSISTEITIDTLQQKITGKTKVVFTAINDISKAYLDAQKYESVISLNDKKLSYSENKIWLEGNFKKGKNYEYIFEYVTKPKKALYFWGWDQKNIDTSSPERKQIWSQGQGKYTSYWLPSIDNMNDKIVFDLKINFNKEYQVISNGNLVSKTEKNNITTWHYQMQKPMSSYLVVLAIGAYIKKESKSDSGVILENYIYPDRLQDFESTYKNHKEIFNFLELEIGVPYPWKVFKQVPIHDFLYGGMENTTCTLFDDHYIVDKNAFQDKNFINISAHELAHNWFGNLITETESNHHWLHEGFATYFALKAEREIFGNDYFYFKLYETAEQLNSVNEKKSSTPLVTPKGSSLNYYQRGAWTLYALEEFIGQVNFKKAVRLFLNEFSYKNVTTDNFLNIVKQVSKKDLSNFEQKWIYGVEFPTKEALELLTKHNFMQNYLRLAGERTQPLIGKYQYLNEALSFPVNPFLGEEVISQLHQESSDKTNLLLQKAFNSNHPKIEFALANILNPVQKLFKSEMESLLKSNSYATVEAALYSLWNSFETDKMKYLKATDGKVGFNNKNIRTLWLVLALNTKGFSNEERTSFFKELQNYTAVNHSIGTKINAIRFLEMLQSFNDQSLLNLSIGATHPNWQFNKFCSKTIERLLKKSKYLQKFNRLKEQLPIKVQRLIPTE